MHALRSSLLPFLGLVALVLATNVGCGPKYPKCNKDDQCAEKGEVCVEGLCQQCRDDSTCAADQTCKGGRCEAKPECINNGDCSDGKVCKSGKCKIECQGNADCGSGLKCMANRCVDQLSCNGNLDCTGGMQCVNGRCTQATSQASTSRCMYPKVQFDFNRAELRPAARTGLQEVVDCLKQKGGTITIEGHADERGTEEFNLALGDRRARTVMNFLQKLGVPAAKLRVISKGENEPIDSGHDEGAWEKNRRAEFME